MVRDLVEKMLCTSRQRIELSMRYPTQPERPGCRPLPRAAAPRAPRKPEKAGRWRGR
jgi:hypothetical protein